MEKDIKGCVYFFKHVGLTPIKIGFTTNESPINRFEAFKTYAPYGSELIGFIRSYNSKELETKLHQRFYSKRLNGEWFDISLEECENTIKFFSGLEDTQEMNSFQVAWAKRIREKRIDNINNFSEQKYILFKEFFSKYATDEKNISVILNQAYLRDFLKCSAIDFKKIMEKENLIYKAYRENGGVKKGYKLFKS